MRFNLIVISMILSHTISFTNPAIELVWNELPMSVTFEKSLRDGRPSMAFFHASWCSYCHKLKDEVFSVNAVREKMAEYHLVSIDGDDKGAGSKFFKSVFGRGFPTTIFYNSSGEEIDRLVGYLPPEDFTNLLKANLSQRNILEILEEQYLEAPKDRQPELRYNIIEKQFDMGQWDNVLKGIRSYSAHPTYAKYSFDLKLMRGIIYLKKKSYTLARLYFKVAWDSAISEKQYMDAVRWLSKLYKVTKEPEKRLEVFQAAIDKYGSVAAYNGYAWNASKTKTNLDTALSHALKAVKLSKRKVRVLDTLAAVHYARKEFTETLRISREILATKPKSSVYAKKHKKYLNAFRKSLMSD